MTEHALIEVPRGLNGVAVASTEIGDVRGDEGFYHYRGHDAVALARTRSFEDVWHLVARGELPNQAAGAAFTCEVAQARILPDALATMIPVIAAQPGTVTDHLRAVFGLAGGALGLGALVDLAPGARADQALRLAAVVPSAVGACTAPAPAGHW